MSTPARTKGDLVATFRTHLDEVRRAVDARLADLWRETEASLAVHGDAVAKMAASARELTVRGGKRFRAAMLVASFSGVAPRASIEPALTAGAAFELLQSYLLIQDDWMDADPVRRGGASAHVALAGAFGSEHLGAASAILAGDLTWGLAVRTLASARVTAHRRLRALDLLCSVHQDVVAGQQIDMLGRAQDVEAMHALKTGSYTVRGPLLLGATLAGAPKRTMTALAAYAAPLGVAFQLRDDLLGAFGKEADTGKREGNDLRAGKRTALFATAEPMLAPQDRAAIDAVFGKPDAPDDDVREAVRALERCGARGAVEQRLDALCSEGVARAAKLPLSSKARAVLSGAAMALGAR